MVQLGGNSIIIFGVAVFLLIPRSAPECLIEAPPHTPKLTIKNLRPEYFRVLMVIGGWTTGIFTRR